MNPRGLLQVTLLASALVGACGGDAVSPPVAARAYDDPGFVASGGHEMRYGMLLAGDLATGVAAAYGIDRNARQVVVSVTVLRQRPAALPLPVHARVTGTWRGLIGESRPLEFRSVLEGPAVSYVAVAPVRSREAMIFEIAALPGGTTVPLAARVTREFDADPRGP